MNCDFHGCKKPATGMAVQHKNLITPRPITLCPFHQAELIGFIEARNAFALEKFAKEGGLGTLIINVPLVTIFNRTFRVTHRKDGSL